MANIFSNSKIEVIVLGAGQDVGRSCIVVRMGDKTVMFDCGIHMGYNDHRKFPDFKQLAHYYPNAKSYDEVIDCVIISHFHLDHVGALPYFTEHAHPNKFNNKIIMTHPTKAICPILLNDWSKIQRKQYHNKDNKKLTFNSDDVIKCMNKSTGVCLHETYEISNNFTIKAYYAGHVLGAAMFLVKYNNLSVLYTGDYNMTPDRHLGGASVDRCRPDLLISESTYATMIRESRRIRERNFFTKVHECISAGGKVLIPVFALGRAQELMILLSSYWERMDLNIPIYFSAGLAQKANDYYKFFIFWCNESVKRNLLQNQQNVFDFTHIKKWDHSYTHMERPCVLLATTGMLHAGTSLRVFKEWCSDDKNLLVLPGYCVQNTVGGQILSGKKIIQIENKSYKVAIQIANLSFSAHADMKGILQLIRNVGPKNVMLVHGEHKKMKSLKRKIECELALKCFTPFNGQYLKIEPWKYLAVNVNRKDVYNNNKLNGHLILDKNNHDIQFDNNNSDVCDLLNVSQHQVLFDLFCCFTPKHLLKNKKDTKAALLWLYDTVKRNLCDDYKVEMNAKCIEIYDNNESGHAKNCVSMYIEKGRNDDENENENKMDVDCENHKHENGNKLSVKIIYPHNLIDTATLVQSLVNVTCDSYC